VRVEPNSNGTALADRPRLFLLYHEVRSGGSEYSYVIDKEIFARHIDLFAHLRTSNPSALLPEVTFDDGHISNLEIAAPILESKNLIAHFFITAGWTGKRPGYMGWPELRSLQQAGQTIGAHGWSHALLTHCDDAQLQDELARSRHALEDGLGCSITTMSLPGGRYNRRVLAACEQAGYTRVFTSEPRPEQIPLRTTVGRLNILGDAQPDWIAKLLDPRNPALSRLQRQDRIKQMVKSLLGDRLYAKLWALRNRQETEPEDTWSAAE
jgi:peptidoglycan/xylan/chitin deacetylase (PgdA/CDA1 family)